MSSELITYIQAQRLQHIEDTKIRDALLQSGWKADDIDKAFQNLIAQKSTAKKQNKLPLIIFLIVFFIVSVISVGAFWKFKKTPTAPPALLSMPTATLIPTQTLGSTSSAIILESVPVTGTFELEITSQVSKIGNNYKGTIDSVELLPNSHEPISTNKPNIFDYEFVIKNQKDELLGSYPMVIIGIEQGDLVSRTYTGTGAGFTDIPFQPDIYKIQLATKNGQILAEKILQKKEITLEIITPPQKPTTLQPIPLTIRISPEDQSYNMIATYHNLQGESVGTAYYGANFQGGMKTIDLAPLKNLLFLKEGVWNVDFAIYSQDSTKEYLYKNIKVDGGEPTNLIFKISGDGYQTLLNSTILANTNISLTTHISEDFFNNPHAIKDLCDHGDCYQFEWSGEGVTFGTFETFQKTSELKPTYISDRRKLECRAEGQGTKKITLRVTKNDRVISQDNYTFTLSGNTDSIRNTYCLAVTE